MIELITNGALPKPAKCIACGYSGLDRWYIKFQAFIPRYGQILLCVAKLESEDQTGCMNEAARRFPVGFMNRDDADKILVDNERLQKENEHLGVATDRFVADFNGLVSAFLDDIKGTDPGVAPLFGDSFEANLTG